MATAATRPPRWTDDELKALKRYYPLHGPSWEGWAELLPGRSASSIGVKAHRLGTVPPKHTAYTPKEEALLRRHYPCHGGGWDGWAKLLPGRTRNSIDKHARDMGLSYLSGHWLPEEDVLVAENYPTHGPSWEGWAELLPGRTTEAISARAKTLGACKQARGTLRFMRPTTLAATGEWTSEQKQYLLWQLDAVARKTGHNVWNVVEMANEMASKMVNEMQGKVVANG